MISEAPNFPSAPSLFLQTRTQATSALTCHFASVRFRACEEVEELIDRRIAIAEAYERQRRKAITQLCVSTLYCLRHPCATLLLQAGIHPKIVSERGHASIVLTLDTYSHVLPTMQDEATTQIQRMLYV